MTDELQPVRCRLCSPSNYPQLNFMKLTRRFIQLAAHVRESNAMSIVDFSASGMAVKDIQRFDAWIAANALALAQELEFLLPLAKEPCCECDGNGCVHCQPEVWFACPNHPDHRVQSNGWVPCPTCGTDLVMDSENA